MSEDKSIVNVKNEEKVTKKFIDMLSDANGSMNYLVKISNEFIRKRLQETLMVTAVADFKYVTDTQRDIDEIKDNNEVISLKSEVYRSKMDKLATDQYSPIEMIDKTIVGSLRFKIDEHVIKMLKDHVKKRGTILTWAINGITDKNKPNALAYYALDYRVINDWKWSDDSRYLRLMTDNTYQKLLETDCYNRIEHDYNEGLIRIFDNLSLRDDIMYVIIDFAEYYDFIEDHKTFIQCEGQDINIYHEMNYLLKPKDYVKVMVIRPLGVDLEL